MADIYRVILRQLLSRGRVAMLGFFVLLMLAVAIGVNRGDNRDVTEAGAGLVNSLGLTFAVPLVCLVFATSALGDHYESGSLVYFWLKPIPRWHVVVAATAATVSIAGPVLAVGFAIAALLTGGGAGLTVGTFLATFLAVFAYTGVFTALGLITTRALLWGIGYILLIEGLIAQFGLINKIALLAYSRSIVSELADVDLDLGTVLWPIAAAVLLAVGGLGVAAGSWRLNKMTIP